MIKYWLIAFVIVALLFAWYQKKQGQAFWRTFFLTFAMLIGMGALLVKVFS